MATADRQGRGDESKRLKDPQGWENDDHRFVLPDSLGLLARWMAAMLPSVVLQHSYSCQKQMVIS